MEQKDFWQEELAVKRTHVYAPGYLRRVGATLTQSLNTIVFMSKNPCESLSARAFRKRDGRWFGFVSHVIDSWFHILGYPDHCEQAHKSDYLRALSYVEDIYNDVYCSINEEIQQRREGD